jgi:hypothetical protein
MTDSNRTAGELPGLMEERRRYEAWLAALDARRDTTPAHVVDRVKADYQGRMRQVEERLAAHRHAISEERTSLESRRSLLEAEEQLRRDERAELELRAHVGELAGDDSESAFRAVDDALATMAGEKRTLMTRITELNALLDYKPANVAPAAEPSVETSAEEPAEDKSALHTPGGSFDELAFLTDVVGEKKTAGSDIVRDEPASESLLDGLDQAPRANAEPPLAANVPANTPIVLRTSSTIEQAKTLKCNECGAMNYATEWYCERCGAELAAL